MNKNIRLKIVRHKDRTEWVKKQRKTLKEHQKAWGIIAQNISNLFFKLRIIWYDLKVLIEPMLVW